MDRRLEKGGEKKGTKGAFSLAGEKLKAAKAGAGGTLQGLLGLGGRFFGGIKEALRSETARDVCKGGAALIYTALVSGAAPMAQVYPFGIALLCAADSLHMALCTLLGALFSLFFIEQPLLYGASLISVFFVRMALGGFGLVKTEHRYRRTKGSFSVRDSPFQRCESGGSRALFRVKNAFSTTASVKMLCALGGAVTVGAGLIIIEGSLGYDVFASAFLAAAAPVLTFGFSAVGDRELRPGVRKAGAAALGFAFFLAVAPFTVGGMNVGAVLAFLAAMYVSVGVGITDGILFGLFSGMAMEPALAPMYAVGAAATGALYCFSAGAASVCAAVLGISWALYADGIAAFSSVMPEVLLAAGIFYPLAYFRLLPEKKELFERDALVEMYELQSEERLCLGDRGDAAQRVKSISDAMSHMATVFRELSQRLKAPCTADCNTICQAAFSAVCASCGKRGLCHAKEDFKDGRLLRLVSGSLKLRGRVSIDSFPDSVKRGCPSVDLIAQQINREYVGFYESVLKTDKTAVIAEDYDSLARLIRETVCSPDPEEKLNESLSQSLRDAFADNGITGERISVYGVQRPRVFVRGMDARDLSFGSRDIKNLVERCVASRMTSPRLSVEYDRLDLYMEAEKQFSFKLGHFSRQADGSEPNGDAVCSFSLAEGKSAMLICDGMGSGRDAALTARVSTVFLEKMLSSGCPVGSALKLLNNFTRERRIECFSTVDLLVVDAYTGKAEFIKSGAAPSFVLRENRLFKMECDTAPVGILKEVNAGSVSFSLKDGDVIIMISDGILPDNEENSAWLYDILCSAHVSSKPPSIAAGEILRQARLHLDPSSQDDGTVGVVHVRGEF